MAEKPNGRSLGPWGKLFASIVERKAHYSDRQFRVFVECLCMAIRSRGELASRKALEARLGEAEIAFLFDEGDLHERRGVTTVHRWEVYQAPQDRTNAERQARFRIRRKKASAPVGERVDNGSNGVSAPLVPTSTSTSRESLPNESSTSEPAHESFYPEADGERDSLDRFYELTAIRPWGRNVGRWLRELEATHGLVHVLAALEVEAKLGVNEKLVGRVATRLAKQADRAVAARKAESRPVDPLQEQIRAAIGARYVEREPVVDVEAGRKLQAAMQSGGTFGSFLGASGRGGDMKPVGAVLSSGGAVRAADGGTSLTDVRGPAREASGTGSTLAGREALPPSLPGSPGIPDRTARPRPNGQDAKEAS